MDTTNHCPNCEALAKENEQLRKALWQLMLSADELQSKCGQDDPDVIAVRLDLDDAQVALSSPPSGMRVVSVEQLREILGAIRRPIPRDVPRDQHINSLLCSTEDRLSALLGGDDD